MHVVRGREAPAAHERIAETQTLVRRRRDREPEQRQPRERRQHVQPHEHRHRQEHEDADANARTSASRSRGSGDASTIARTYAAVRNGVASPEDDHLRGERLSRGDLRHRRDRQPERRATARSGARRAGSTRRRAVRPCAPSAAAAAAAPSASRVSPYPLSDARRYRPSLWNRVSVDTACPRSRARLVERRARAVRRFRSCRSGSVRCSTTGRSIVIDLTRDGLRRFRRSSACCSRRRSSPPSGAPTTASSSARRPARRCGGCSR